MDKDKIYHIPLTDIFYDDQFNCRGEITPQSVHDLSRSIADQGLQCPIILRTAEAAGITSHPYHLVAGHRRFKAIEIFLKWDTISALIRESLDTEAAKLVNLTENIDREDLPLLEQARAIQQAFGDMPLREIGRRLHRGYHWIKYRLELLKLSTRIQNYVTNGDLSLRDVDLLMRLPTNLRDQEADILVQKKQLGVPASIRIHRKRLRKTSEIKHMLAKILQAGHQGLSTYALAWALGEIETEALEKYIHDPSFNPTTDVDIDES